MTTRANSTMSARSAELGTTSPTAVSVAFVVTGNLISMKNRRNIGVNRQTGKPFSRKSKDMLRYVADFCAQVPPSARHLMMGSLTQSLRISGTVYYRSRRSDLDIELLKDCLQLAGVIRNDRYITQNAMVAQVDAKNPRVDLLLEYT